MLGQYSLRQKGPVLLDGNLRVPLLIAEAKAGSDELTAPADLGPADLACSVDLVLNQPQIPSLSMGSRALINFCRVW